jgi:hypothetical protein
MEATEGEVPVLVMRRLDAPGSSAIRSSLDGYAGKHLWFAELSDDGRLAVLGREGGIAVVDTDSGREVASASGEQLGIDPRSALQISRFVFTGDTVVGFFGAPRRIGLPLVISTFNFRTGQVAAGPKFEGIDSIRSVRNGRALVSGRNAPLAVVEGSTILELLPAGDLVGSASLLEGGRAAAFVKRGADPRLMLWSPEGQLIFDVPSPSGSSVFAGEPRAGWLALGAGADHSKLPRTVFVDSTTGAVVRVEEGLTPIGNGFEQRTEPAGSPASRLFVGSNGEIVRLDPETGRRETILASTAPEDARYR